MPAANLCVTGSSSSTVTKLPGRGRDRDRGSGTTFVMTSANLQPQIVIDRGARLASHSAHSNVTANSALAAAAASSASSAAAADLHLGRRRPSGLTAQSSSRYLEGKVSHGGSGQYQGHGFKAEACQYPRTK